MALFGISLGAIVAAIGAAVVGIGAAVAHKLGSKSYSGSVEDRVDVEAATREYKEKVGKAAENAEKEAIENSMRIFQAITDELGKNSDFRDVCDWVKERKEDCKTKMSGTISGYVNRRLTENDPEFDQVLRMKPGKEKENAVKRQISQIIKDADQVFQKKLFSEVSSLNDELCDRMEKIASRCADEAKDKEEKMKSLSKDYNDQEKALEQAEAEYNVTYNAAACMETAFSNGHAAT